MSAPRKRLTIVELARLAGVSSTTASFVLNGRADQHRISQETREKVLRVAKEHQFRPSHLARALRSNRSGTLGLIIPDLTNSGFSATARELEKLCRANGYQLLIASSDDDPEQEKAMVTSLVERKVDGLVTASGMTDDSFYRDIASQCPVVQMDRYTTGSALPHVVTNGEQATASLVEAMAAQCSELAYIGGLLKLSPSHHRLAGFREGLKRAGVQEQEQLICHRDFQPESGYVLMAQLKEKLGRLPEGVFCASFSLLQGVLRYLKEHDALDADIRLGSFDDHELLDCMPVAVDSIIQDCQGLAAHSFELLSRLIDGKDVEERQVILPAHIHWRSTLG